jgi:methionyl-tRNA formyltransferase
MAILDILEYPDPRLRTKAKPVNVVDDSVRTLIDDMLETMYEAPGIGLAASQVNVHRRIIVVDVSENRDEPHAFINPELEVFGERVETEEGCLSVPGFYEPVTRSEGVRVKAVDRHGLPLEAEFEGLLAVCIQHECDHLEGKLFVDYLSSLPVSERLRLGFAGTPSFAATILGALLETEHEMVLVLTQPDRRTGRGRKLMASPVKILAEESRIPVWDPVSLKNVSLTAEHLDLLIVAAYGLILPPHVLEAPRLGCLNVHASLLPRWRGAAPVERAIAAGDEETGVCLMQMDAGLDTGPVYAVERVAIGDRETGGELEARLAEIGARLLIENLPDIESMTPQPQPSSGATYAEKLTAADTGVAWEGDAAGIARRIRALSDRLPVTVFARAEAEGQQIRIRLLAADAEIPSTTAEQHAPAAPGTIVSTDRTGVRVACGKDILKITRLQLNRGKGTPMAAGAAANGYPNLFGPGRVLEASAGE